MAAREEVISDISLGYYHCPLVPLQQSNNTNEEDYHENKYHKGKRQRNCHHT